jgi:glycosyltransferase involved in cell wall biosynthesis
MTRPSYIADGPSRAAQPCAKLISICIPTFNRASYLGEAIESILPQIGRDTELLVYDTGSTDHTRDLMKQFTKQSANIRYLRLETRLGVDETLLLLLEESRGEYVWFFGSDDVLKEGTVQKIRERILQTPERPALIYVNHEVVDIKRRLLIASQVGTQRDREYSEGWRAVPWLGMNLGYISACVLHRGRALAVRSASEFVGSRWVSMHLYLCSLLSGGSLQYIGQPLFEARRNPSACAEYAEVFVRQADRILRDARHRGFPWNAIYRTRERICRSQYLRFVFSWRCDNPDELARTFPEILRAFWMCPSLWFLLLPVRMVPPRLARAVRDSLRRWRERRNARLGSLDRRTTGRRGEVQLTGGFAAEPKEGTECKG